MHEMSPNEILDILSNGRKTGELATVNTDGASHLMLIQFVRDGDHFVFAVSNGSITAKNISHDNYVTLAMEIKEPNDAFIIIEDTVEVQQDLSKQDRKKWATKIARRYMSESQIEEYATPHSEDSKRFMRLIIARLIIKSDVSITWQFNDEYLERYK